MHVAGFVLAGLVLGGAAGMWVAQRQPDGWALIVPLGSAAAALGAIAGAVVGVVTR